MLLLNKTAYTVSTIVSLALAALAIGSQIFKGGLQQPFTLTQLTGSGLGVEY